MRHTDEQTSRLVIKAVYLRPDAVGAASPIGEVIKSDVASA